MGGMMGSAGMGAWTLSLAVVVAAATGGVLVARAVGTRREPAPTPLPPAESPVVREAKDALRLRYAHGEISREAYLQGKAELED